jgi:uncharacterized damage-inducible protein DinB
MTNTDLRSPIGSFTPDPEPTPAKRADWIRSLSEHPARLRSAVQGLTTQQLDTPYRPDGWTIRQITHHLADNQMHGFLRMRWALTEDSPTVPLYDQDRWSQLPDATEQPVRASIDLLAALYRRWRYLLASLDDADFTRTLTHPKAGSMTIDDALQLYDWHGRHHIAQIDRCCERHGWTQFAALS